MYVCISMYVMYVCMYVYVYVYIYVYMYMYMYMYAYFGEKGNISKQLQEKPNSKEPGWINTQNKFTINNQSAISVL